MKQSEKSLKYIYLKQIAESIKQFRRINKMSQEAVARKIGLDNSSISFFELEKFYPSSTSLEKFESIGIAITQEQKDLARNMKAFRKLKSNSWEVEFDKAFTRVYNSDNAEGYDGDDWKVSRNREPVKPSIIKEFIKNVVLKGGE